MSASKRTLVGFSNGVVTVSEAQPENGNLTGLQHHGLLMVCKPYPAICACALPYRGVLRASNIQPTAVQFDSQSTVQVPLTGQLFGHLF